MQGVSDFDKSAIFDFKHGGCMNDRMTGKQQIANLGQLTETLQELVCAFRSSAICLQIAHSPQFSIIINTVVVLCLLSCIVQLVIFSGPGPEETRRLPPALGRFEMQRPTKRTQPLYRGLQASGNIVYTIMAQVPCSMPRSLHAG